jgi:hypothetical protein
MLKNVAELDRPERRIKYGAKKDAIFVQYNSDEHTHARKHTLITFNT